MSDENFDLSVHTWIPRNRYKTLLAQSQKQDIGIGHLIRAIIIATVPPTEELATRPPRLHDAEREEYIRRRNAEGASDGEIGRETGNSAGAITARRRRMGIPAARLVGGQPKPKEADA